MVITILATQEIMTFSLGRDPLSDSQFILAQEIDRL
jgi:hypothetical protein